LFENNRNLIIQINVIIFRTAVDIGKYKQNEL